MESGSVPEVPGDDQHDRKVFWEPRQVLGGFMGQGKGANQPTKGCAPPSPIPRDQGVWGAPSRVPTSWLGGQVTQGGDPICPGCRPPRGNPRAPPLALAPIYSGGFGAAQHTSLSLPRRSPTSLPPHLSRCLVKPCWNARPSITTTPLCYCWTESSPTSPSLLAGSRHGRRHRAVRVLNAEVSFVRH